LQYIPFAALPVPRRQLSVVSGPLSEKEKSNGRRTTDNGQPLIVDHEIVTLPSASALAVLRKELAGRPPAAKTVAVLADPVFDKNDERVQQSQVKAEKELSEPSANSGDATDLMPGVTRSAKESGVESLDRLRWSRHEAEWITAPVLAGERLMALDFAANKPKAASADLNQYRIVHFATHVLLNSQHPELSGIVLSLVDEQGQPQDGFLRLHEVYNLKLGADLVVLSACETALGKEIKGEGLVGLTRGFMYAGAARVVASLWSVDDKATAKLMKQFYEGMLREGLRPVAALRAAQVAMWEKKKSPYFWAAFVLQGEWK
jgi:CHAT domain-containing protein